MIDTSQPDKYRWEIRLVRYESIKQMQTGGWADYPQDREVMNNTDEWEPFQMDQHNVYFRRLAPGQYT